jgi:hypothetical protein
MPLDDSQWERGCCAMTHQGADAQGNTVLLTRNYGADVTRVEVYGPDNRQIGELRELPHAEAEALLA